MRRGECFGVGRKANVRGVLGDIGTIKFRRGVFLTFAVDWTRL